MTRPTLTVAVIALNEAPRLATLLPRLRFADEVLVIDGGSTDDTVAVASRAGATVVSRTFDHFAAQRNAALAAAQGDWVFYIDADEMPTDALIAELAECLPSSYGGYRVPIRSSIFGRPFRFAGTQDDAPLRIVRRNAGRWVGAVHETFAMGDGVGRLAAHLRHVTLPTVAAFHAKMQRYTRLAAQDLVAHGVSPRFGDRWIRPPRELFRRLIWKQGWLDGPAGWRFCWLSAKSEWVLATEHHRLWNAAAARGELRCNSAGLAVGGVAV